MRLTFRLAVFLVAATPAAAQSVLYVRVGAAGAGTGGSWADAFADLKPALAAAQPGTEVWVASGTYRPSSGTDRSATFTLRDGVALYGGFAGTESQLHERDWRKNVTVLSGDIGVSGSAGDNSYHVVTGTSIGSTTVLDGFVVEAGNANGNNEPLGDAGGGLYARSGSPTVRNVVFRFNSAPNGGAVVNRDGSSGSFVNCLFYGNQSGANGGAVVNANGSGATFTNVTFSGNSAFVGGALYNSGSVVTVRNAILWGDVGGEITNVAGGSAAVSNAVVQGGYTGGTAVLDRDPGFRSPAAGDFTLRATSPTLDLGLAAFLPADVDDLDGDGDTAERLPFDLAAGQRVSGSGVDLGAFEFAVPCPSGSVVYVNATAAGQEDGSSWTNAFSSLRAALATAVGCGYTGEVWVARGTYTPSATADPTRSFALRDGVALYGGFVGTEQSRGERDVQANPTVLDGADVTHHIVTADGVGASAVLDGFVVTRGQSPETSYGGGLRIVGASPTVSNVTFSSNRALTGAFFGTGGGGGASVEGGSPLFDGCTFLRNRTGSSGGGLLVRSGSPRIVRTSFVENAYGFSTVGTGASVLGGTAVFEDVRFERNTGSGGGLYVRGGSVVVTRATFVANRADGYSIGGAGMRVAGGDVALLNVRFVGNVLSVDNTPVGDRGVGLGAGLAVYGGRVTLVNGAFVGNVFTGGDYQRGAAVYVAGGGDVTAVQTTFTGNGCNASCVGFVGGSASVAGRMSFHNSVTRDASPLDQTSGSVLDVNHAVVRGGYNNGASVLNTDPLFVRTPSPGPDARWGTADDDYGDLHLQTGSSAVDFGALVLLPQDTYDIDGDGNTQEPFPMDIEGGTRVRGAGVDLGAYEGAGGVPAEPAPPLSTRMLLVTPNPVRSVGDIMLSTQAPDWVRVAVYDARGRELVVLYDGLLEAAEHTFPLNARAFPRGVYIVRAAAGTWGITTRLVVVR